ncbi:MAG: DUF3800 domain-containing protein [Phycisphaerae bacterium]
MRLLYLDDPGSADNRAQDYLVLVGLSVSESQAHWLTSQLDQIAAEILPDDPHSVEFHASAIFNGRNDPWRGLGRERQRETIRRVLRVLPAAHETARAFACAIHKPSFSNEDPLERALEDLCTRFDLYLERVGRAGPRNQRERGLILLDDSSRATSLQRIARDFRLHGNRWGRFDRHLVDTPVFVDSQASRLIQVADHIAYAVFRRFSSGDTSYFDVIGSRFDSDASGVIHGLAHLQKIDQNCMCPACITRRQPRA